MKDEFIIDKSNNRPLSSSQNQHNVKDQQNEQTFDENNVNTVRID